MARLFSRSPSHRLLIGFLCGSILTASLICWVRRRQVYQPASSSFEPTTIEQALERPLNQVDLVDEPLPSAATKLQALSGVPIVVDEAGLTFVGLQNEKVTVHLQNATLSAVLYELVAGHSTSISSLGWEPNRNRIMISSPGMQGWGYATTCRCYDVRDILAKSPFVAGSGELVEHSGPPIPAPMLLPCDKLEKLITDCVAPDSWTVSGGLRGSVNCLGDRLIVVQSYENQIAVRNLLAELRRQIPLASPPGPPPPEVRRWDARRSRWISIDPARGEAMMRAILPEFRVEGVSMQTALDRFSDVTGLVVTVDPEVAALVRDAKKINVGLKKAPATDVLRAILDSSCGPRLHWWMSGQQCSICSHSVCADHRVMKQYDIRDWLKSAVERVPGTPAARAGEDVTELLTDALKKSFGPDSWLESGGVLGSVRESGGFLFVNQTWENQEHVRRFIETVRRGGAEAILSAPTKKRESP